MVSKPQTQANQTSSMASSNSYGSSSSSSTTCPFIPNFTQFILVKLDSSNYLMWQSQVLHVLCSNDLLGIVDGTESCPPKLLTDEEGQSTLNPKYTIWNKKDQFILSWINATLSENVLAVCLWLEYNKAGMVYLDKQICFPISIKDLSY
jgi:hypothetical protein